MSNHLQTRPALEPKRPNARISKGWTPERRARYAALARLWQPWRHSSGPRTAAGKARVAMNALRHGYRSRAWTLKAQRIRRAIRLCADTLLLARMLVRERDRRFRHPHEVSALQGGVEARQRDSRGATGASIRCSPLAAPRFRQPGLRKTKYTWSESWPERPVCGSSG
jgi:hypothetical protein